METKQLLFLMRLLSALESAMLTAQVSMPDYLNEDISTAVEMIEKEILK